MAKDGTARGGARPGSGPKRKALTEKISAGKTAAVIDLPDAPNLEGVDMPPVKKYMKAKQKNGTNLCAEEVSEESRLHRTCEYTAYQSVCYERGKTDSV